MKKLTKTGIKHTNRGMALAAIGFLVLFLGIDQGDGWKAFSGLCIMLAAALWLHWRLQCRKT